MELATNNWVQLKQEHVVTEHSTPGLYRQSTLRPHKALTQVRQKPALSPHFSCTILQQSSQSFTAFRKDGFIVITVTKSDDGYSWLITSHPLIGKHHKPSVVILIQTKSHPWPSVAQLTWGVEVMGQTCPWTAIHK